MSNMGYCRFENTLKDLEDCYQALQDNGLESLSDEERRAALKLINVCDGFASEFGGIDEEDEDEE